MGKLGRDAVVAIRELGKRAMNKSQIAEMMDVTEGTVRYHLRREGKADGRSKVRRIEEAGLAEVVRFWWKREVEESKGRRPAAMSALWDHLREEHGYDGSYKSVRLAPRCFTWVGRTSIFRRSCRS